MILLTDGLHSDSIERIQGKNRPTPHAPSKCGFRLFIELRQGIHIPAGRCQAKPSNLQDSTFTTFQPDNLPTQSMPILTAIQNFCQPAELLCMRKPSMQGWVTMDSIPICGTRALLTIRRTSALLYFADYGFSTSEFARLRFPVVSRMNWNTIKEMACLRKSRELFPSALSAVGAASRLE